MFDSIIKFLKELFKMDTEVELDGGTPEGMEVEDPISKFYSLM